MHAYTCTCIFIFPLSLEGCRDFQFLVVIRNLIIDSKFHIEIYSFIDHYLQWCLHGCQLMHQNYFLVLYISYQTTSLNLCGIIIRDPTLPRFVYQQTVSIHGLPILLNCNKEVKRKRLARRFLATLCIYKEVLKMWQKLCIFLLVVTGCSGFGKTTYVWF